jgi:hypothetical protein
LHKAQLYEQARRHTTMEVYIHVWLAGIFKLHST